MSDHWPEENDLDQDPDHTEWVVLVYLWAIAMVAIVATVVL